MNKYLFLDFDGMLNMTGTARDCYYTTFMQIIKYNFQICIKLLRKKERQLTPLSHINLNFNIFIPSAKP